MWLAILTGVITALATLYGLWREWQAYRQNQALRLSNAAMVAVRRTEASLVRPRLGERLADTVQRFTLTNASNPLGPVPYRALLFGELQRNMRLPEEDKRLAKTTATNHLITSIKAPMISVAVLCAILQGLPSPPLRLYTDDQINQHIHTLHEQIENAYGLRLRPSLDLVQQLVYFCGSTSLPTPV